MALAAPSATDVRANGSPRLHPTFGRLARAATVLGVVLALSLQGVASAATTTVSIYDFGYNPSEAVARVGDRVTWSWDGASQHSSTSSPSMPYKWTSTILPPGSTYSKVFTYAGRFRYHCQVHSGMEGYVSIAPRVSPRTAAAGTVFSVAFGSVDLKSNLQVVIEQLPPGADPLEGWEPFTTVTSGRSTPWDSTGRAVGTWGFRVTLQNVATGRTSFAGRAATATVT
jgi:plastocyanin